MIIGLLVLLWFLKVLLVLAVLAVLALGADYVYYEIKLRLKPRSPETIEEKAPKSSTPNIDALINNAKAQKRFRRQSEEEAWEGFFETAYIRGFESNGTLRRYGKKMPSRKAFQFFNLMDELSATVVQNQKDASIFEQTEDL